MQIFKEEQAMDLKGRDFLTLKDFTPEEIAYLLDLSAELKEKKKKGIPVDTLRGKNGRCRRYGIRCMSLYS